MRLLQAFRHRNFRYYWLSVLLQAITMLWENLILTWFVLELTGSPFLTGLVGFFRQLPTLFIGLVSGAIADRFDKRKVLIVTQLTLMLLYLSLATLILGGLTEIWLIFAFVLAIGTTHVLYQPTRQVTISFIVEKEELTNALALEWSAQGIMGIVGGGAGGLLIDAIGGANCLYLTAAIHGISTLALSQVRFRSAERRQSSPLKDIAEGFKYIKGNQVILGTLMLHGLWNLLTTPLQQSILAVVARDVLKTGAPGLGMLSSARSAGLMLSAFVAASLKDVKRQGRLILVAAGLDGLMWALFALSNWLPTSLILIAAVGIFDNALSIIKSSVFLIGCSPDMRGRVAGVRSWVISLVTFGNLWSGALTQSMGAPITILAGGGLFTLSTIILAAAAPKLRKF